MKKDLTSFLRREVSMRTVLFLLALYAPALAAEGQVKWSLTFPNAEGNGKAKTFNGIADYQSADQRILITPHGNTVMELRVWRTGSRLCLTLSPKYIKPRATGQFLIGGGNMSSSEPQLLEPQGVEPSMSWGRGAYLITEEIREPEIRVRIVR